MAEQMRRSDETEPRIGSWLAGIFLLFSVPWIIIGDLLVASIGDVADLELVQTLKGLLFVFICAALAKYFGDRFHAQLLGYYRRERRLREHLVRAEYVGEIASWEKDLGDGRTFCSENCDVLFGTSIAATESFEDVLRAHIHPDDGDRVAQLRGDWWRDGGTLELEYRLADPQGLTKWIEERAEFVEDEGGKIRYAVGTIRDISKLKAAKAARDAAEARAERREALVRMAAEKANFGGWRYELGDEHEIWSDGTARVRGLQPNIRISPVEAMEHYANGDRERMRSLFNSCIEDGEAFDDIFRMNTADGRQIVVRTLGEPQYDETGKIVAVQGAIQDVTELVSAREEADRRNAQLQSVLASIGDGFATLDQEWTVTFINRRGSELFGLNPGKVQGRSFWDLFPAARGSRFEHKCREAIETGESRSSVEYVSAISRWLDVNVHPTPGGLAIYFRDDSEKQHARQWLKLLESAVQSLDDILTVVKVGTGEWDEQEVIYANNTTEKQLGYSSEEFIGKSPWFFVDTVRSGRAVSELQRAISAGTSATAEVFVNAKSGGGRWFEAHTSPIHDRKGQITHRVAVLRDVTDRKRYEERILESEERFRLISRASSDVIWDWDIATGFFWVSDNYEDVFGFDISNEPQTFDASIARIHPDDRERVRNSLFDAIQSDLSTWSAEYKVRNAHGSYSIVEDRAFIIRNSEGQALRMVAGMTDVTELRELDEKLRASQKLEAIGHLTGGVAHDFNNLLTIILGNSELLIDSVTDPGQERMANAILNAAERGAYLTDGLLAFSRRQPLEPVPVDVNELILRSESLLRQGVEEGITLRFALEAEDAVVLIDPARLQSAILNLVINSRHAIGERGTITVETSTRIFDDTSEVEAADLAAGRYLAISVTDDGIGMTRDVQQRAFDPFFTTKPAGKGTGLGLSSTYGFVKQSGGEARIYSEIGEGTTVNIYLPLANEETDAVAPPSQKDVPPGRGEHILVVEDDPDLRQHAEAQIRALGYRVSVAENADEALALLEQDPSVDLLFTDVIMPGSMHGAELARTARAAYPDLKVLYTSGYTKNVTLNKGRLDENVELLPKPYRREDLARRLREQLDV